MRNQIILFFIIFIVLSIIVFAVSKIEKEKTKITYQDQKLDVIFAKSVIQKAQGLSNTELDDFDSDGMLFIFSDYNVRDFWMRQMKFDLDVLWIKDGKIMKIDRGVKSPENSGKIERMSSSPFEVDMVLELPVGALDKYGFEVGGEIELGR